jgi:xanthosine utilization system XapX-like protein
MHYAILRIRMQYPPVLCTGITPINVGMKIVQFNLAF